MEEELKRTAQIGDIDAFYGILERDPEILKTIEEKHFAETPLHVAATHAQTEFAIEILSLMPSFGKKLNPSGHSPLDLALHNGHRETVKQLIKFDPELIRVRSRERKTPLHYVAETDDSDLVAEFLLACPTAIKELTIRGETAVHLAVLRGSRNAFQVLMGWITRTDKDILGWKDNKGNTLLHIATLTSKIEVIKRLIKEKVDLDDTNQENQTALDIALSRISFRESTENLTTHSADATLHIVADRIPNQEDVKIQKLLQQAGAQESFKLRNLMSMLDILTSNKDKKCRKRAKVHVDLEKGITDETRNVILVAMVLIVATTFQAVLSPPGGSWLRQDHDNNNNRNVTSPSMPPALRTISYRNWKKDTLFYSFTIVNSFTFVTSLGLIVLMMPFKRYTSPLLLYSLVSLLITYMLCSTIITPPEKMKFIVALQIVGYLGFYLVILKPMLSPGKIWKPYWRVTKRNVIRAGGSVYEMERRVRLQKYVASSS